MSAISLDEAIDRWVAEGSPDEGLAELQEAFGLGLLHGNVFNARVLRGRSGKFADGQHTINPSKLRDKRNSMPRLKTRADSSGTHVQQVTASGSSKQVLKTLQGVRGGVKGKQFKIYAGAANETTAHKELHAAGTKRLKRLSKESHKEAHAAARRGDSTHAVSASLLGQAYDQAQADPEQRLKHGAAELYDKRSAKLEKRIARGVKQSHRKITPAAGASRSAHTLSAAEISFNDAGHISQATLLAYAEDAASKPTTVEMYRNKDGAYHPSRAPLHADIIDMFLRERDEQGRLSRTTPYLKPPSGPPTVVYTGGGMASGKGSVIKMLKARGEWPEGAVLIDPDDAKAELPEFLQSALDDPSANLRVYGEAWDLAQAVTAQAQKRGLNVVVDGIADTSADEVARRVKTFTDKGYVNPRIDYVSVPTEEALRRAKSRAAKGDKPADKRMIPEVIMRAVHRDVSATIPGVLARSKELGLTVNVYDTNQGKDEITGQFKPPKLVATANPAGEVTHPDSSGYQSILHKASEDIQGVRRVHSEAKGATVPGGQSIGPVDPAVEKQVGRQLAAAMPHSPNVKLPSQSDPTQMLTDAQVKGLPALRELGGDIARSVDGIVEDASKGQTLQETGDSVLAHMDQAHVVIGPVKSLKRSLEKLAADGTPNDSTFLQDALRATVTVPTAQDLPGAIDKIVKAMDARGWNVEREKNRLADGEGSQRMDGSGYGDLLFNVRAPESAGGNVAEMQVNTNPLWWTKEIGPGHALYEQQRTINATLQIEGRKPTRQEQDLLKLADEAAKTLYDRAWATSLNGGGDSNLATVILGGAEERKMHLMQVKQLTDGAAALGSP